MSVHATFAIINSEQEAGIDPPTFARVLDRIKKDPGLDDTRRRDLRSAVTGFCNKLHLEPADTVASMDVVRNRIRDVHPNQLRISQKRWQNILSGVRSAIERYGAVPIRDLRCADLTEPWRSLHARLPAPGLRYSLSRFIKFCALNRIRPEHVSAVTFTAFTDWLSVHTTNPNPAQKARTSVGFWNTAVDTIPGWPQQRILLPPAREAYCLQWEAMTDSFVTEAEAWLRVLGADNWADPDAPLRPLRISTIQARRFQLQQAYSILVRSGIIPQSITGLATLVDPANAEIILRFFYEKSGSKPSSQAAGMAHCLLSIARHRIKAPEDQIRRLKTMKRRVTPQNTGLTEKNRATLQQFEDDSNKAALLLFPAKAMQKAERLKKTKPQTAVLAAQMAVAVEILTMMPIRLKNLADLHLRRNLDWRGDRLFVVIPSDNVKNDVPIEFELLGSSAAIVRRYIDRFRPLVRNGSGYLFPGSIKGKPKNQTQLSRQITKTLFKATGLKITPHQFRHVAAKIWLDDNPGSYEVVRRILRHRSIDTTTEAYTGFETRSATRQYDCFLIDQRRRFAEVGGLNG